MPVSLLHTSICRGLLLAAVAGLVNGQDVDLLFSDVPRGYFVQPGTTLEIGVRASCAEDVPLEVRWIRGDGSPLGEPIVLRSNSRTRLKLEGVERGYLGLVFSSSNPRVAFVPNPPGFASRAYGFAVLPEREASGEPDASSIFGMVHGRREDPYLGPHLKTLTWNTTSAKWWLREMTQRRSHGKLELPLLSGDGWRSDGHRLLTEAELDRLGQRFRDYCRADPSVPAWELGVEENLRKRYSKEPRYFDNLRAKAERVRAVADEIGSDTRLVYNVEGFKYDQVEQLLASGAFEPFDVFSSHPYRWKQFESPEGWLPEHVSRLRSLLAAHEFGERELWFTEVGLPVRGNPDSRGFFGYPKSEVAVPGCTPDYAAVYLVKLHLLAGASGVQRIYWYNYQNRGDDIHDAEDHFGLRAYAPSKGWGDPLPAYVAYAQLVLTLEGRPFRELRHPQPDVYLLEHAGPAGSVWAAWTHPARDVELPWSQLREGLMPDGIEAVRDLYGAELECGTGGLRLSGRPVFVVPR